MDSQILIDEKLSLKIPSLEDAQAIYGAVDSDRGHIRTWLAWVDKTSSVADITENIQKRIEQFQSGEAASYIIYYENKPIGSVGFISIDMNHKKGEIGYWLHSQFTGRGIMTQCVAACIEQGFKKLDLHRIEIRCNSRNSKSAAIPKRLYFTLEATLRENRLENGVYSDTLIFGLLSNEWKG